ncbi:MAG: cupin domain-containing protein [Dehalococcoidia bacterium]|nr:cupin domain-containing protein [Dehalococcoidia bacterium]
MKTISFRDIEPMQSAPGVGRVSQGVTMRRIFGKEDGASFSMRVIEDEPSDELPHGLHAHAWEHQIFVVKGKGIIITEHEKIVVGAGDCVFIPSNELHTIGPRAGTEPFLFVDCISAL